MKFSRRVLFGLPVCAVVPAAEPSVYERAARHAEAVAKRMREVAERIRVKHLGQVVSCHVYPGLGPSVMVPPQRWSVEGGKLTIWARKIRTSDTDDAFATIERKLREHNAMVAGRIA
jgi:hypothetical protein